MSPIDLQRLLDETFVSCVEHCPSATSTNDVAMQLAAAEDASLPLLVTTDRQTAGRGRGTNQWWSADGSLTFSLVLDASTCELQTHERPKLSLLVGLSVASAVESIAPSTPVQLKWPNDVYLAGKKLCGILVESVPAKPDHLCVGVGINVNNSFAEAPNELRQIAVSLADHHGCRHDRAELLVAFAKRLRAELDTAAERAAELPERWRDRCFLQGRTVTIESGSQTVSGVCEGIDAAGALLVRDGGVVQRCVAGIVASIL